MSGDTQCRHRWWLMFWINLAHRSGRALRSDSVKNYVRPPRHETFMGLITVEPAGQAVASTTNRRWRVLESHHLPTYHLRALPLPLGAARDVGHVVV